MASAAQVLANRRNARKSTGPRTAEGKLVVARNAVRHGLSARCPVITTEDQADFDRHRSEMLGDINPAGPMESMLAERIIDLSWRLRRTVDIQNQTINALHADTTENPLARLTRSLRPNPANKAHAPDLHLARLTIKDFSNARVLDRLLMYERRLENSLYKTILELQRLQLMRKLNPNPTQARQP